jgi:cobalt-zinc-cadmium efflux system outer membrane protein
LSQDIPWFGKRDLKREVAELEGESAKGRALGTWSDIAARIKTSYAQWYYVHRNERLTREILDLMRRLERIAQVRYSGGLAALQDVIRAQVEQTKLRGELVTLQTEQHHLHTRLNALLARPAEAPLAEPESFARCRRLPGLITPHWRNVSAPVTRCWRLTSANSKRQKKAGNSSTGTATPTSPSAPGQSSTRVRSRNGKLMIEMNIPLQQSSRRSQERESEAMLAAARSRREASTNQVLAELAENLAGIDGARRIEALATDDLLPEAELTFKAALAGYENGKLDFATLLDAQRQIRQARQEQIKAQAEGQARLAEIERLLGEDSMKLAARIASAPWLSQPLAAAGGYWAGKRHVPGHDEATLQAAAVSAGPARNERKILYYRNPMGLPDSSPTPKKDPMGMDYIPVYEGEADEGRSGRGGGRHEADQDQHRQGSEARRQN